MKFGQHKYASLCWKAGIRINVIPKYGGYYLEVEYNKTSEFLAREVIDIKPGKIKYPTNTHEYSDKMGELYQHLYETKVEPKLSAA